MNNYIDPIQWDVGGEGDRPVLKRKGFTFGRLEEERASGIALT